MLIDTGRTPRGGPLAALSKGFAEDLLRQGYGPRTISEHLRCGEARNKFQCWLTLEMMLTRAAEEGARRALNDVGLGGKDAMVPATVQELPIDSAIRAQIG